MILSVKIKLTPSELQAKMLLDTIRIANSACNRISEIAWDSKVFGQFNLHKLSYYNIKSEYSLTSQVIVRCISKVADAYKLDRKTKRSFRELGAITYDSRILSYKLDRRQVSIWTVEGRQKIDFVCHNTEYLQYIKGESDLCFIKGKFYLLQTIDIPSEKEDSVDDFIGVDLGITDIYCLSSGEKFSSKTLNAYKIKRQKICSSLQSKCTKNAKRVLKRLSGRERRTQMIVNHTISKQVVRFAKEQGKGVALEDLAGIGKSLDRFSKKQRGLYKGWAFYQLRTFITYKAQLLGVKVVIVDPRYTSQTCHICNCIGKRSSKIFKCEACGTFDADINAAINISKVGVAISQPENSTLFCALGLKTIR